MQVNFSLSPGYRLKITRASRMSELVDRTITGLAALGGSAAFLEILRRWLQRRQEKRQEQLQLDVRILEEGHALRQEAYQREREALQALSEERERRHKAELAALEAQMQAKLQALARVNEDLARRLQAKVGLATFKAPLTQICLARIRSWSIHLQFSQARNPRFPISGTKVDQGFAPSDPIPSSFLQPQTYGNFGRLHRCLCGAGSIARTEELVSSLHRLHGTFGSGLRWMWHEK